MNALRGRQDVPPVGGEQQALNALLNARNFAEQLSRLRVPDPDAALVVAPGVEVMVSRRDALTVWRVRNAQATRGRSGEDVPNLGRLDVPDSHLVVVGIVRGRQRPAVRGKGDGKHTARARR